MKIHPQFMLRALELAREGIYSTQPNPRVGCVIVKDGVIVGEGWHKAAGSGHAEVIALARAGANAQGATLYVTLEPCSHFGRTPPCCDAIIDAQVQAVVVAMRDPNPLVAGQGLERLQAAGIHVTSGVQEAAAKELNAGYIKRMETGMPLVRIKQAMSLDGRTAVASGESQWITSPAARADVQRMRAASGAVVTGIGTVISDDPSLNVRPTPSALTEEQISRQPLRVVVDSEFRTPAQARLLHLPGESLVVGAHENDAYAQLKKSGVLCQVLGGQDRVDLAALLRYLAEQQINDVLVEAGPQLCGAFLQSGLADEVIIYMASTLLGHEAKPLFHLPGIGRISDQIRLQISGVRYIGDDLRIQARIQL